MKPTANEVQIIKALPAEERMSYFMSRIIDNDEIWSISDSTGWKLKTNAGSKLVELWPHEDYIEQQNENKTMTDLASFSQQYLPFLISANINVEIFPTKASEGKIISASDLKNMLETEAGINEI